MTVLKPFLMLASVAFATGFAGYLAVARVHDLASPSFAAPVAIFTIAPADPAETLDPGQRI